MTHTTIQEKVREKKPKQQTSFGEKELGEAIKEGAITKQYLADPHTIVSSLNRLRSTEITSTYNTNARIYGGLRSIPWPETEFEAHALQELETCRYTGKSHSQ